MKGNNSRRHFYDGKPTREKEIFEEFVKDYGDKIGNIIYASNKDQKRPANEERAAISAIQWLGTNCGRAFLEKVGFKDTRKCGYLDGRVLMADEELD